MLSLFLLPVYCAALLLCGAAAAMFFVEIWPMAIAAVLLLVGLLLIPGPGQKWRRRPGDPR